MKARTVVVLMMLFFGGLVALWWADRSGVPTAAERQRRAGCVLPELIDVPTADIGRVSLVRGSERIELFRQAPRTWAFGGSGPRGLADAAKVEALLTNLKALAPLPDSGTIRVNAKTARDYGLGEQGLLVGLGRSAGRSLGSLVVGKTVGGARYVTPGGAAGRAYVVDARVLTALDEPVESWRERRVFPMNPLEVQRIDIERSQQPPLRLVRFESGWWIVAPFHAPAGDDAVSRLLADLASLRVERFLPASEGPRDRWLTVSLATQPVMPLRLVVGAAPPDRPGVYQATRDGEPVEVPAAPLTALGTDPIALRSKRALPLDTRRANWLVVREGGREHVLARRRAGWVTLRPVPGSADPRVVAGLLSGLESLGATSVLPPGSVANAGLDRPTATVRIWLGEPEDAPGDLPDREPDGAITFRRENPAQRLVYAQTAGDASILALPETAAKLVPTGAFAFRDRGINALPPDRFATIRVERGEKVQVVQSSGRPRDYDHWGMIEPVRAAVEARAVAQLDVLLARLRAANLIEESATDLGPYGLDAPWARITWTFLTAPGQPTPPAGTLLIGGEVPKARGQRYAMLAGSILVFTLAPEAVAILTAELHDRTVLSFPADQVRRLTVTWPDVTRWTVARHEQPFQGLPVWITEAGAGPAGFGSAEINTLIAQLAALNAVRFAQYEGPFPASAGLEPPRLRIEAELAGGLGTRLLRLGAAAPDGLLHATAETGTSGLVGLVPAAPFAAWLQPPSRPGELPADVFAH